MKELLVCLEFGLIDMSGVDSVYGDSDCVLKHGLVMVILCFCAWVCSVVVLVDLDVCSKNPVGL